MAGLHIEMTAPVRVLLHPGDGPFCDTSFTMSFFIPEQYQGNAPDPTNSNVFLEDSPEYSVYVKSFGGYAKEQEIADKAAELAKELDGEGISFKEDSFYFAGYDSPFRFFNRHNEVWLVGADEKSVVE